MHFPFCGKWAYRKFIVKFEMTPIAIGGEILGCLSQTATSSLKNVKGEFLKFRGRIINLDTLS